MVELFTLSIFSLLANNTLPKRSSALHTGTLGTVNGIESFQSGELK